MMIKKIKYALWKIKSLWKDKRDVYALRNWNYIEFDFPYTHENHYGHNKTWISHYITTPESICYVAKSTHDGKISSIRISEHDQTIQYTFSDTKNSSAAIAHYNVIYRALVIPGTYLTMDWDSEDNNVSYSLGYSNTDGLWECVCSENDTNPVTLFSGPETFIVHLLALIETDQVIVTHGTRDIIDLAIGDTNARHS